MKHLSRAESYLLVSVSSSSVKMAGVPLWAPLLPIQPQPKVWKRLHLILNTWQQLERRKGERRKKSWKKRKTEWICQRGPSYLPSVLGSFSWSSLVFSFCFSGIPECVEDPLVWISVRSEGSFAGFLCPVIQLEKFKFPWRNREETRANLTNIKHVCGSSSDIKAVCEENKLDFH